MNQFKINTEVRFGEGALNSLSQFSGVNAVIITDPFMVKSGGAQRIADKLRNCKSVTVFGDVKPDPPIELIAEGLKFLQNADADIVVALGGGSSIDAAKSVTFMARQASGKELPLIAIPTTSGTGSEVTKFAVITDRQQGVKYPLVDDALQPKIAILDPELVKTAPPAITSDTGFDVITHAIEAYVSINAHEMSDALAEKAVELAFEYLPRAYKHGEDLVAREKMHKASCLAGMAFNEVNLGVNHGIAHALGAKFHIPHGRANAMLLPYVIEFNADLDNHFGDEPSRAAQKYAILAKRLGLPSDNVRTAVESLINEIKYMLKMTNTPATLWDAKVTREAFEAEKASIISSALKDATTAANPRPVTAEDVEGILKNLTK